MQFIRQLLLTLVERAGFLVEEDVNNMMTDMSKEVAVTYVVCRKKKHDYMSREVAMVSHVSLLFGG